MSDNETKCKGCGCPIVWAVNPENKKVPLDKRAAVYELLPEGRCKRTFRSFVNHFITCPEREQFKKKPDAEEVW